MGIDRIRIQGVRGIRRELTLAPAGQSLVLRGDNGTGKSSIVAGLLWALRGENAPLMDAKPASEEAYRHNVLDGAGASKVVIELKGGGSITVTASSLNADAAGESLRAGCERSSPFLLRKHLLKFLEDRPVDRFKYLEAFLDLTQADDLREGLLGRARGYETTARESRQTRDSHLRSLVTALPRELTPSTTTWGTLVGAIAQWASRLGVPAEDNTWEGVLAAVERIRPLLAGENLARQRANLQRTLDAFRSLSAEQVPADPHPLIEKAGALVARATDANVATLIEEAERHFAAHKDLVTCPVCEQGIEGERVAGQLRARLDGLRELREVRRQIVATGTTWRTYWTTFDTVRAAYESTRDSAEAERPSVPAPHGVERLTATMDASLFAEEVDRLDAAALGKWISDSAKLCVAALEAELAALPSEHATDDLRRFVQTVESMDKARLAVEVAEATGDDADARAASLSVLAEALRIARQDVARQLLDEISALVAEFYGAVHPPDSDDEVTGAPEIEVQRRSGGSAHVRGKFHAKAVDDPRWVYSDGHLDTVGICVFLALRRFRADRDKSGDPKLMILDDIVLSVDLNHGRRLLDLLRNRFADHQVLIFTHNGLFYDWCAQRLPAFKRKAIARWTLETGPQLGEYPSSIEYINQQIETATSPKLLAQAVMNLMDEWLAEARFAYAIPVQAKYGEEYTLTEIWEPFRSRLRSIEKAMKMPLGRLLALLDELGDLPRMRNRLAAHDNEFAHEYPIATVREIAKRAVELVGVLYCPECTRFATPIPSPQEPEVFRCSPKCERIRFVRPAKNATS